MKQTDPQYKLRLPQDLKDRVEEAAKLSGRSMNAEIVARLQTTFDEAVVTTIEAIAKPGAQESRLEFNADEIADKVIERLEGRKRTLEAEKLVHLHGMGGGSTPAFWAESYRSPLYKILTENTVLVPTRGNDPYGPQKSENAKRRQPKPKK